MDDFANCADCGRRVYDHHQAGEMPAPWVGSGWVRITCVGCTDVETPLRFPVAVGACNWSEG